GAVVVAEREEQLDQVHGAGGVRIAPNIARRVLSRGGTQRRQGAVASLRILASDAAPHPGLPPHAGEGAGRPSRLHARGPPPPSAGEGWGGGKVRPLRRKSSRPTPPPSRPSPACGGRSRAAQPPPRPWPLPPSAGAG